MKNIKSSLTFNSKLISQSEVQLYRLGKCWNSSVIKKIIDQFRPVLFRHHVSMPLFSGLTLLCLLLCPLNEAATLNASSSQSEASRVHSALITEGDDLKILYVTPEKSAKSK